MPPRLPNLFSTDPEIASRYYEMFLAKLLMQDRHADVIAMCRRIRRLAPPEYDKRRLRVFHLMEVHSLAEFKRYGMAWRQLRRAELSHWDSQLDLSTHRWRLEDVPLVTMHYVPLLYHRQQFELGQRLLERVLAVLLTKGAVADVRHFVASPHDGAPHSMFDVTLLHFYEALGQDIRQWTGWNAFVDGIPQRHFTGTGITPSHLKQDVTRLRKLIRTIIQNENAENRLAAAEQQHEIDTFKNRTAERMSTTEAEIDRLFGAFL